MSLENRIIEFKKFSPKEEIKNLIHKIADKIHLESPSDSSLKFVISKYKNKFRGYCRVASQIGIFVADEYGDQPEGVVAKIEKEMSRQLKIWRRCRFN